MTGKDLDGSAAAQMELAELRADLEQARKAEMGHFTWSMAVLSPVGLVMLVGFLTGGLENALWVVVFVMALALQLWQWKKRGREVTKLEKQLEELEGELLT